MVQRSQHASGLPLTLAGLLILLKGTAATEPSPTQHRQCGLPGSVACTCGRSEDALAFLQTHSLQHSATVEEAAAAARRVRASVRYRQTLRNFGDVQYIANLTVGGQVLGGILDTGSFELVVFAQTCSSCGRAGVYQHKQSPHYREGLLVATHSYGSGNLYSAQAFDHVSIGPIESHRQVFWEVTSASMPLLNMANFAAIVGIGPPTAELPVVGSTPPLPLHSEGGANHTPSLKGTAVVNWREGKEHGEMSLGAALERTRSEGFLNNMNVNIFSVCLGAKSGSDGYFIWNDDNPRLFPHVFHQVDVVGTRSWGVKLTNARLAHSLFKVNLGCTESCGAIIDSGTSLLVVPPVAVDQISRAVESLDADCSNLDVLPTLVFNLGGREYSLPPSSYVGDEGNLPGDFRPSWSKGHKVVHKCKLLLMETDTVTQFGPMWVLGMPFFRKYYTTFDLDQSGRSVFMSQATPLCTPGTNATREATSLLGFADGAPREPSADTRNALVSPFVQHAISQKMFSM